VALVVFVHQHVGARFLCAALLADEVNHVGAANFELMFFAQLNQLPQMDAGHVEFSYSGNRSEYLCTTSSRSLDVTVYESMTSPRTDVDAVLEGRSVGS
jgi:hypothetical protein